MNCPSRTDEPPKDAGWNQNPPGLSGDLTTRQDLNGIVNLRTYVASTQKDEPNLSIEQAMPDQVEVFSGDGKHDLPKEQGDVSVQQDRKGQPTSGSIGDPNATTTPKRPRRLESLTNYASKARGVFVKFGKFIGPGFIISVAYIDPGNYSTDVAAGAATRFKLLFIVLMANVFAIVLQSLAVRLGTVTGMNLAEHCRAHLPKWLNIALYILGEAAIIATDIAEVIGSAIALNLLLKIPLVAGCAITLVDVLVILMFYSPNGSMRRIRAFEFFVMALVLGVVICFCIQLSLISADTTVGSVFAGYLPSSTVIRGQGIYLSCGILGATVMPHSLYLGSGMVQSRLRDFDISTGRLPAAQSTNANDSTSTDAETSHPITESKLPPYQPSLAAIRHCLNYSIAEVAISLFTFALFVNSAILIVAGASLYTPQNPSETDSLFSIHALLSSSLAPAAGTIFALALLLSGTSAGIVCTIAGQMLSEGALNWTMKPWLRRLLTRSLSITPSIIIAGAVGKKGLNSALNASQVALSVILPLVSAPLIYFTCRNRYMIVGGARARTRTRTRLRTYRQQQQQQQQTHDEASGNSDTTDAASASGSPREVQITTSPSSHPNSNPYTRRTTTEADEEEDDDDDLDLDLEPAPPSGPTLESNSNLEAEPVVKMRNHIIVSILAVSIWLVIVVMNVALLVLLGLGKT